MDPILPAVASTKGTLDYRIDTMAIYMRLLQDGHRKMADQISKTH